MGRPVRVVGTILIVAGLGMLGWTATVWLWKDPFTSIYTRLEQRRAAAAYDAEKRRFLDLLAREASGQQAGSTEGERAAASAREDRVEIAPARVPAVASRFRRSRVAGDAVARLVVPRLGLSGYVLSGTDSGTLRGGPGHYRGSFLPGEGELIYIAGHRTTYGAPFARIDELRSGDVIRLELPYGRFEYRVTAHRIVTANATWVLKSRHREVVALQACHPRFFASHRYIVYAVPVQRPTAMPDASAVAGLHRPAPS